GRFVAYSTDDGVFVRELATGTTELVSVSNAGEAASRSSYTGSEPLSADGRFVAFFSLAPNLDPTDANQTDDVFVRDRRARMTERVSVARVPVLTAGNLVMQPKQPWAGTTFSATVRIAGDDGPPASVAVRCPAKLRARSVRVVAASFGSGIAR